MSNVREGFFRFGFLPASREWFFCILYFVFCIFFLSALSVSESFFRCSVSVMCNGLSRP